MTATTAMTFVQFIEKATNELSEPLAQHDPDGLAVREALLLAERAAAITDTLPDTAGSLASWQRFYAAIADAVAQLQNDLEAPAVLPDRYGPDADTEAALRPALVTLTSRLGDLFTARVLSKAGPPWRLLVWAQVGHRLDQAKAALDDENS